MTPLERAARAIRAEVYESGIAGDQVHEAAAKRAARAVLTAIRDEAGELCGDAYRTVIALRGESETVLAREVFITMIDAALAEEG